MTRSLRRVRRGLRIVVGLVLLFAVGALFAALMLPRVEGIESDRQTVAAERAGASYLRPLTRLLAELANAQSATASRRPIDAVALTAAANAVSEADAAHGDRLQTRQRWVDLSKAVAELVGAGPTGGSAAGYADAVVMCAEPIRQSATHRRSVRMRLSLAIPRRRRRGAGTDAGCRQHRLRRPRHKRGFERVQ